MALSKYALELPFGSFEQLPLEMIHHIFALTSPAGLGNLANTSKAMRSAVEEWLFTGAKKNLKSLYWGNVNCLDENEVSSLKAKYAEYGVLIRRLTCVNTTMNRLSFADKFLRQIPGVPFYNSPAVMHVHLPMECLGQFFKTFMLGWEDFECGQAFNYIQKKANMEKTVFKLLYKKEGFSEYQEVIIRLAYRCIFIDSAEDSQKKLFWIQQIFSNKSTYHKVKLMYILFGPTAAGGKIDWDLPNNMSPGDILTQHEKFQEIGEIIQFLKTKNWEGEHFITWFLNELLELPDSWEDAAMAAILYHAGPALGAKILSQRFAHDYVRESFVVTGMILFISEFDYKRFIYTLKAMLKSMGSRCCFYFVANFIQTLIDTCNEVYTYRDDLRPQVMLKLLNLLKNVDKKWDSYTVM